MCGDVICFLFHSSSYKVTVGGGENESEDEDDDEGDAAAAAKEGTRNGEKDAAGSRVVEELIDD